MATCPRQEVRAKTDEYGVEMVLRFLSTYESVEIKTDGEPSIVEIARRQNNDSGTDECWRTSRDMERWNVRLEQCRRSCERVTWTCKNV